MCVCEGFALALLQRLEEAARVEDEERRLRKRALGVAHVKNTGPYVRASALRYDASRRLHGCRLSATRGTIACAWIAQCVRVAGAALVVREIQSGRTPPRRAIDRSARSKVWTSLTISPGRPTPLISTVRSELGSERCRCGGSSWLRLTRCGLGRRRGCRADLSSCHGPRSCVQR